MDAEARKHGLGLHGRVHKNTAAYLTLMLLALPLPILNTSQPSPRDSQVVLAGPGGCLTQPTEEESAYSTPKKLHGQPRSRNEYGCEGGIT